MWLQRLLLFLMLVFALAQTVIGQTTQKASLNLAGAKMVIATAIAKAHELDAPGGTIAVVDDGGNLLALERLGGTFAASANVAIGKARTAALFKKPTKVFEEIVNNGRTTMVTLDDFTPLQGGVPVMFDGQVIGAVGVSGAASADQDELLAQAGATATLEMTATAQTSLTAAELHKDSADQFRFFDHEKIAAAFDQGMPLVENAEFKIHASRRTKPGMAEVHDDETDIVYVVSGSATLVIGGIVVDPHVVAAGETRGAAIDGGQMTQLVPGDVLVIPNGTPHWFKSVDGPFLYFVVKPISR